MNSKFIKFKDVQVRDDGKIIQVYVKNLDDFSENQLPCFVDNNVSILDKEHLNGDVLDLDAFFDVSSVRKLDKF